MLLSGDFNCVLDVNLDRSTPPLARAPAHKIARGMLKWMRNWHLEKVWRIQHCNNLEYSFYSFVHDIHVRLDMILCTYTVCASFLDTEYLGRTYSDHNPLKATLKLGREPSPIPQWCLQPAALVDPVFRDSLLNHIMEYFEANEGTASVLGWNGRPSRL